MSLGPLARLTAHWIGQQMISSCCRGRGTWKGRGWGQDSTRLWLMTGAQPRLPVGKNVTLDWMWRGTDFKAPPDPPSVRWRGERGTHKACRYRHTAPPDGFWLESRRHVQSQKWNLLVDRPTWHPAAGLIISHLNYEHEKCVALLVRIRFGGVFLSFFPR